MGYYSALLLSRLAMNKKVAQSEVQHKIWACKATFLSCFIAVTATPNIKKTF